jgi:hypothetical protein
MRCAGFVILNRRRRTDELMNWWLRGSNPPVPSILVGCQQTRLNQFVTARVSPILQIVKASVNYRF